MEEAVDADAKSIRVGRQVEGGLEVFDLPLPAVVSAQKGLNEPRYPTLKGVMGEGLGEATRLGGGAVEAVWLTDKAGEDGVKQLGAWGATKVWLLENAAFSPYMGEVWTPVLADLAQKESPKAIFAPVTSK